MNNYRHSLWVLVALVGFFGACKTNDVPFEALVSLSSGQLSIIEDTGTTTIDVSIHAVSEEDVMVELTFGGTATLNDDYSVSSQMVTVGAGSLSTSVNVTAIQDTADEGNETIEVTIASVTGGREDGAQSLNILIEDDDGSGSQPLLILNEILYDPSNNGLDGDANGDGQYVHAEDEFLEFVNLSSQPIDLSGYLIFDAENLQINSPNHTFPSGTIVPAGKAIVVFGGGTPTGTFGGAIVQTSTSGDMNLNNAGDVMTLTDPNQNPVIEFDIEPLSNNPNESYTRNPDLTGNFEQHGSNTALLFSPGTKIDGSPF